ncbi:hypothetical protein GCM10008014_41310 [Paenibacillus silvae]|uniref:Uncharacterized protein n=1 Tax=Paenibacillus silvae TaxID=1325358 RepID=A0ABQ1ZHW0_9BACL|nr:hypothetical protein GCM10008014_41310 [Paenibacillus silvae]
MHFTNVRCIINNTYVIMIIIIELVYRYIVSSNDRDHAYDFIDKGERTSNEYNSAKG